MKNIMILFRISVILTILVLVAHCQNSSFFTLNLNIPNSLNALLGQIQHFKPMKNFRLALGTTKLGYILSLEIAKKTDSQKNVNYDNEKIVPLNETKVDDNNLKENQIQDDKRQERQIDDADLKKKLLNDNVLKARQLYADDLNTKQLHNDDLKKNQLYDNRMGKNEFYANYIKSKLYDNYLIKKKIYEDHMKKKLYYDDVMKKNKFYDDQFQKKTFYDNRLKEHQFNDDQHNEKNIDYTRLNQNYDHDHQNNLHTSDENDGNDLDLFKFNIKGLKDAIIMLQAFTRRNIHSSNINLQSWFSNILKDIARRMDQIRPYVEMGPGSIKTPIMRYPPKFLEGRLKHLMKIKEKMANESLALK